MTIPIFRPYDEFDFFQSYSRHINETNDYFGKLVGITRPGSHREASICLATGLNGTGKVHGPDAYDDMERPYEFKTNHLLVTAFSISGWLSLPIIERYRRTHWLFAIYNNFYMMELWYMPPGSLDEYLDRWALSILERGPTKNGHSIPVSFVRSNGIQYVDQGSHV